MFNEAEQIAEAKSAEEDDDDLPELPDTGLPDAHPAAPSKRGPKPLPAHLPRERVEYDLPEDQKVCTYCNPLPHIGEDASEQLHYEVEAAVLQNARFKYTCWHCEAGAERTPIVLAPMPAQQPPAATRAGS